MFGRTVTLFRLFGIPVRVDASWLIIAALITWSLAAGFFPHYVPGWGGQAYFAMALLGALGLFASIVLHEAAHALAGRRYGVVVRSITLFVFGGVADMRAEPPRPRAEFWIAIAGPLASTVLAAVFAGAYLAVGAVRGPAPVAGVLFWLAWANALLAAFNIVPAFPLDGGRVLRSALWGWKHSLRRATRIASRVGGVFGLALMGVGALAFLGGSLLAGVWWFLIGLWLRSASAMAWQQQLLKGLLKGERVRGHTNPDVMRVQASLSLADLAAAWAGHAHHRLCAVFDGSSLVGALRLDDLTRVPRDAWATRTARDIMRKLSAETCVGIAAPLRIALEQAQRARATTLLVVEHGRLRGVLSLPETMEALTLRLKLESAEGVAAPARAPTPAPKEVPHELVRR